MGFVCHVEHPHKFISNYLATLETPPELRQEAWNLANDSLRTTLCVRFKSEVVACGVVYAAARRFQVPLPENPPWWKVFDADKSGIDEVCRVLAELYSLPKAQYIPVCKDGDSFTFSNKSRDSQSQPIPKEISQTSPTANIKPVSAAINPESVGAKEVLVRAAIDKMKDSKKSDDESKNMSVEGEAREEPLPKSNSELKTEAKAGILTVNGIERKQRGTEIKPRIAVIVPRIEERIQEDIQGNQDITHQEIVTTTVPLILQGRRIAIDIIRACHFTGRAAIGSWYYLGGASLGGLS
nr:isoform 2 of cyclin-l1-1 [Quercus suber]